MPWEEIIADKEELWIQFSVVGWFQQFYGMKKYASGNLSVYIL